MLAACSLACLFALAPAGDDQPAFPDLGLTLKLPKLDTLERKEATAKYCKGAWTGRLKTSEIHVQLNVFPNADYDLVEPEDVLEAWREVMCDPATKDAADHETKFTFEGTRSLAGPFGCTPILALVQASAQKKADANAKGLVLLAGGIVTSGGWAL